MGNITKYQSIVLMGKITSGKGTQANSIQQAFKGVVYSNGDKMRATAKLETVFGLKMKEVYESGALMPEWIASYWMAHALVSEFPAETVIFEGVAKKPHEAELFHEIHKWLGRSYLVFNLVVSDEEVYKRSEARSRDVVDSPKSVLRRLEEYHTYTEHSIEFFRTQGTLVDIDGAKSPEKVKEQIFNHLME